MGESYRTASEVVCRRMSTPSRPLARAALAGLTLGMLGAALIFLYFAITNFQADCTFPDTEECNFELGNAREVGRLQGFASIGCALLGGGLFLLWRKR